MNLFSFFANIPKVPLFLFLILGSAIGFEIVYLAGKKKKKEKPDETEAIVVPSSKETISKKTLVPFTPLPKNLSLKPKKSKKELLIFILSILLLATIPAAVYLVKQKQEIRKRAEVGKVLPNRDSCNLIEIDVRELQECPRLAKVEDGKVVPVNPGQTNNFSTYTNIYTLKNIAQDETPHLVKYKTYSSFCTTPYGHLYPPKNWIVCNDNHQSEENEVNIEPNQAVEIKVERSSPTGTACGTYQLDLDIFAVDGDESCIYRGPNPGETVGAWGYCETGIACEEITPTPTPLETPPPDEVTPTVTPSPTPKIECSAIKVYDETGSKQLTKEELELLPPGTNIILAVLGTGGDFDKAQFRINGSNWTETMKKNAAGEFILLIPLPQPPESGKIVFEAMVHDPSGWH